MAAVARGSYTRTRGRARGIELAAILDFFASAPPSVAKELDLAVLELGERAAFSVGAEPKPLLFNRALGLADDRRVLAVETSDRVDGEPGPSFRNMVRAGFEEAYVQQWRVRS